ncbi:MAG: winged helix-turn-helix transcriptional regulator [Candidatus Aenigmarchaeota archaeon]|nr:winged helix-turn-helix transcriptional regulator [Candidatus Aenigmarchaeota archaeon]
MFKSVFKSKDDEKENLRKIVKLLDMRYAQMAIEIERLKNLGQKIDRIEAKVLNIDDTISSTGIKLQQRTIAVKTKEAIRMILQKYNEITPAQLSKLIKLSRTRCNEYLKQMEDEGTMMSRVDSRKKFYSLRQ